MPRTRITVVLTEHEQLFNRYNSNKHTHSKTVTIQSKKRPMASEDEQASRGVEEGWVLRPVSLCMTEVEDRGSRSGWHNFEFLQ